MRKRFLKQFLAAMLIACTVLTGVPLTTAHASVTINGKVYEIGDYYTDPTNGNIYEVSSTNELTLIEEGDGKPVSEKSVTIDGKVYHTGDIYIDPANGDKYEIDGDEMILVEEGEGSKTYDSLTEMYKDYTPTIITPTSTVVYKTRGKDIYAYTGSEPIQTVTISVDNAYSTANSWMLRGTSKVSDEGVDYTSFAFFFKNFKYGGKTTHYEYELYEMNSKGKFVKVKTAKVKLKDFNDFGNSYVGWIDYMTKNTTYKMKLRLYGKVDGKTAHTKWGTGSWLGTVTNQNKSRIITGSSTKVNGTNKNKKVSTHIYRPKFSEIFEEIYGTRYGDVSYNNKTKKIYTAKSVTISWKKTTGASKYIIYYIKSTGKANKPWTYAKLATTTKTSITLKNAKVNGKTIYFTQDGVLADGGCIAIKSVGTINKTKIYSPIALVNGYNTLN